MSDTGFTHIALAVRDLDASIAFYEKYAGMRVVHRRDSDDGEGGVVWVSDMTRPFVIVLVHQPGVVDAPVGPFGRSRTRRGLPQERPRGSRSAGRLLGVHRRPRRE